MPEIISGGEPGDEVLAPMEQLALSKSQVRCLFAYFAIIQIVGLAISSFVLIQDPQTNEQVNLWTTIGAIGMALVGSATYYIRKLYKQLISAEIDINHDRLMEMKRLGGIAYFASRPLFACGFALLVYVVCKGGAFRFDIRQLQDVVRIPIHSYGAELPIRLLVRKNRSPA